MKERIKELRKALGLSGEKFGENIGLTRFAISNIEIGKNNVTDQTIKLICLTYNVNEDWLRTGQGTMFNENSDLLSSLKKQYNLNDFQVNIVKEYLKLNSSEKALIDKLVASMAKHANNEEV